MKENPNIRNSILLLKSTKGAAKFKVPIGQKNRYQVHCEGILEQKLAIEILPKTPFNSSPKENLKNTVPAED